MGTDVHWYLERRHRDGAWETIMSKSYFYFSLEPGGFSPARLQMPHFLFGMRNYDWFGLLSGLRGEALPGLGPLARQGLPEALSEHADSSLMSDDLHSHGWFTLADLKSWPEAISREGRLRKDDRFSDAFNLVEMQTLALENILSAKSPDSPPVDNILVGPEYCPETDARFPEMAGESAHARLARQQRISGLMPIAPDTLRVIIAYDN